MRDVLLRDLRELSIAIAARIAIIRGPIGLRGNLLEAIVRSAKKVNALVVCPELKIERALIQNLALDTSTSKELNLLVISGGRRIPRHRSKRPKMRDESVHLLRGQIEGGHSGGGASHTHERSQLGCATGRDLRLNIRP